MTYPEVEPRPHLIERINILGVGVHAVTLASATQRVFAALTAGTKGYVCVTGVHGIMEAQKDAAFKALLNSSLLTTPDGMPAVWIGKLKGYNRIERVFGPDLMLEICAHSQAYGYTHFLYGGAPGVAEQLRHVLIKKFPKLAIVGTYTPPFRTLNSTERASLEKLIGQLKPDIMWIGLSTPKQEWFMAQNLAALDTRLMLGVGAAFDFHTGRIRDAPRWVKNAGLQWLHRLWQEPRRLWKRYLTSNSKFLLMTALQLAGLRHDELAAGSGNDLDWELPQSS